MSFYPDLEAILQGEDKDRLLEARRSFRSILSYLFWAAVGVAIVFALIWYTEDKRLRWLAVAPVLILAEVLRKFHDDLYTFGLHKVMHYNGRLSLSYSVPSVKYAHIRSITVNQTMWGRILDFGDLLVQTAAQDSNELSIQGVRDPQGLAALLEELRNHSRKLQESGDPTAELDHSVGDHDE